MYKGIKLAVVEAKSEDLGLGESVAQAKQYAQKLTVETTYSTNGKQIYSVCMIYSICMKTGTEGLVGNYLGLAYKLNIFTNMVDLLALTGLTVYATAHKYSKQL